MCSTELLLLKIGKTQGKRLCQCPVLEMTPCDFIKIGLRLTFS